VAMKHAPEGLLVDNRNLSVVKKRKEEKYLVILSNQTVVIDTEFQAMKRARRHQKPISDMHMTDARIHAQETSLTKLLESLEVKNTEILNRLL
jgi:hypothetical protein